MSVGIRGWLVCPIVRPGTKQNANSKQKINNKTTTKQMPPMTTESAKRERRLPVSSWVNQHVLRVAMVNNKFGSIEKWKWEVGYRNNFCWNLERYSRAAALSVKRYIKHTPVVGQSFRPGGTFPRVRGVGPLSRYRLRSLRSSALMVYARPLL